MDDVEEFIFFEAGLLLPVVEAPTGELALGKEAPKAAAVAAALNELKGCDPKELLSGLLGGGEMTNELDDEELEEEEEETPLERDGEMAVAADAESIK